jgi:hypothetical protein
MDCFEKHIVAFIDFLGSKDFSEKENIENRFECIGFLREIKNLDSDVIIQGRNNFKEFRVASSFYSDSLVLSWSLGQPGLPVDAHIIDNSILPCILSIITKKVIKIT